MNYLIAFISKQEGISVSVSYSILSVSDSLSNDLCQSG